jgi:phosphatidylinositol alpha-1,6-mannosyltransferase
VDLGRFTPDADGEAVRREFGLGLRPVVGSVARLAPNRGHELLIHGFARLLGRLPDARLLLVGKGEMLGRLQALVEGLGLSGQIIFSGYRDHDLPQVLAAMDCFAMMGAGSDESCRAALEAMAAGKPVVARRVGALPETVVDGETGLLVPVEQQAAPAFEPVDPTRFSRDLARSINALLHDPALRKAMGVNGRRRVEALFSWGAIAGKVLALYDALVRKPPA